MALRRSAVGILALGLAAGCGNANSTRPSEVRQDIVRGTRAIQTTSDRRRLDAAVATAAARLRGAHATTPRERRAKALALEGFRLARQGVGYLIRFDENDSGEVAAATRDAARADRFLRLAAMRLRAAGLMLGVRIGDVRGY